MTEAGGKIFDILEKEPSRAGEVRRFMNYYLPTADKLLTQYRELGGSGSQGENVRGAMTVVENSLEMIAVAFERQLDGLYRHEAMDIQTDIDVLETMLASDGIRPQTRLKKPRLKRKRRNKPMSEIKLTLNPTPAAEPAAEAAAAAPRPFRSRCSPPRSRRRSTSSPSRSTSPTPIWCFPTAPTPSRASPNSPTRRWKTSRPRIWTKWAT